MMSRLSAASKLRDAFGDRKPPDISRKITACVSCRKVKVKCNVASSGPPCARCSTRGLSCTVNKSLQMILEDDASWKERIEQRLEALEKAQQQVGTTENATVHDPAAVIEDACISSSYHSGSGNLDGPDATGLDARSTDHSTLNLVSNLGMFPAASVGSNKSPDINLPTMDIISRGVLSLDVGEKFLAYFHRHLNRFLHNVLNERDTIADIRTRSSLLTTAICTVVSFRSSPDLYKACYDAFVNEVSSRLFAPHSTYDDVRALCIAALWLEEIGPTLIALAVRIGGQLDLHRCVTKMPHTKVECYDRTRLFYLVCLCDHHCSLKYGRPPMTQDWRSLKSPTTFLHSEFSTHRDLGLVSQLELWTTTRAVFERFGADVESLAAIQQANEVYKLARAYEAWHSAWCNILPADGVAASITELYYNCALLYLYSHIYRGGSKHPTTTMDSRITELRDRFQRHAHTVLQIMDDVDLRLIDLPTYFGTMLAFALVSCIKTARENECSDGDKQDILHLLRRLALRIQQIGIPKPTSHPYAGIAKGLEQATDGLEGDADQHHQLSTAITFDENLLMDDIWDVDFTDFGSNWMDFNGH